MSRRLSLEFEGFDGIEIELYDCPTSDAIAAVLPVEAEVSRWGDEVYFSLPTDAPAGVEVDELNAGDVAWWVPGNAFCIFFGPTPGGGGRIVPASPVTVVGHVACDPLRLRDAVDGASLTLRAL